MTENEALALFERVPLFDLAGAADEVRREIVGDRAFGGGPGGSSGDDPDFGSGPGGSSGVYRNFAGRVWDSKLADPGVVTWQIDRNVNITNVCVSGCKFCNFHCRPAETERAYVLAIEDYIPRIEQTFALGGDQLLLQGGLHPRLGIEFYTELFKELKRRFPTLKLHALGAPEVAHIARISGLTTRETLERLVAAGLDSLPGAGAEILVDEVRRRISPAKPTAQQWLDVMREAHRMNIPTSATMMYGHIETPRHIVQHLLKIRDLQAEKPDGAHGFVAFIPWIFRSTGTVLEREMAREQELRSRFSPSAFRPWIFRSTGTVLEREMAQALGLKTDGPNTIRQHFSPLNYLRVIALSRLILNNIRNIQASWLTVGVQTAQMALHSGANDMGSIMIEENVVASAGADNRFDAAGIQKAISEAGFRPVLRDQLYRPR